MRRCQVMCHFFPPARYTRNRLKMQSSGGFVKKTVPTVKGAASPLSLLGDSKVSWGLGFVKTYFR